MECDMSNRRRPSPREDERQKLETVWKKNRDRRKAGWRPTSPDLEDLERLGIDPREFENLWTDTFVDAHGNQVTLHGERARAAGAALEQHFARLRDNVENWNKKVVDAKGRTVVRAKEISGEDVMEVLEIASMWTNDPAFEAARQAMRRHRLDTGDDRNSGQRSPARPAARRRTGRRGR